MKTKILFFHFDLGNGGAEKVLINLLKCLDYSKYDVTLYLLFKHGINLSSLPSNVKLKYLFNRAPFRGIIHLLKLLSPKALHKLLIKEKYDIEIAYLEGAPTRIISGCPDRDTKLFPWIHTQAGKSFFKSYRSLREAEKTYYRFNKVIFVSEFAKQTFLDTTGWSNLSLGVCHNVINTDEIKELSKESIDLQLSPSKINMCSVGRLNKIKGYSRLVYILGELKNNITQDWQLYLLGQGEEKQLIENIILENKLQEHIHLLGYDMNPYKYVSKMDLFICSSYAEGYSTAVTESIVVGTPVITTECSGMSEILGDSQAGIIVENSDDGLRYILKDLLTGKIDLDTLKVNAIKRSNYFNQSNIKEFEDVINEL
ncbi:MAG: glycosyltransferase [Bacteroidales bacterium]|nr:glycosyltransferase [Bacteroidales bacterium]